MAGNTIDAIVGWRRMRGFRTVKKGWAKVFMPRTTARHNRNKAMGALRSTSGLPLSFRICQSSCRWALHTNRIAFQAFMSGRLCTRASAVHLGLDWEAPPKSKEFQFYVSIRNGAWESKGTSPPPVILSPAAKVTQACPSGMISRTEFCLRR